MEKLLEVGRIINTHGVRGEVKLEPWADSPDFLRRFTTLYLDGLGVRASCRAHGRFVLIKLDGIDDMNAAEALRNKVVYISREDAELGDGEYFIADLVGFEAFDENGAALGLVTDVLSLPAGEILEIKGEKEHLVPLRQEFIVSRDMDAHRLTLRLIEGM